MIARSDPTPVTVPSERDRDSRRIHRPLWLVGLASALVAAVAGIIVYAAARAAGVPMELTEVFEDHFARMPIMNMAWAALLEGGVAGTALAAACRRWTRHPRSYFLVLTTIGLVASFVLPAVSDASTATKVVLSVSHVVVAAIIVPALTLALPAGMTRGQSAPGTRPTVQPAVRARSGREGEDQPMG